MNHKVEETWVATITVGTQEGYDGNKFRYEGVKFCIQQFSRDHSDPCPVKLSPSEILFKDYEEECVDVMIIQYPRFPRTIKVLEKFTIDLAKHLLVELKQHRISAIMPDRTEYFETCEECCGGANVS